MRYYPYGSTRDEDPYGSLYTTKLFTGQRRDATSLYYYGARYYAHGIGRFISADTIVPSKKNPQSLNRYSYCLNNPLRYVDPTGHQAQGLLAAAAALLANPVFGKILAFGLVYTAAVQATMSGESFDLTGNAWVDNVFVTVATGLGGLASAVTNAGVGVVSDMPQPDNSSILNKPIIDILGDALHTVTGWLFRPVYNSDTTDGPDENRNWRQDKPLSDGEIRALERHEIDPHDYKDDATQDLYKDRQGNIYVKPKNGQCPGEPTGLNINDYWP